MAAASGPTLREGAEARVEKLPFCQRCYNAQFKSKRGVPEPEPPVAGECIQTCGGSPGAAVRISAARKRPRCGGPSKKHQGEDVVGPGCVTDAPPAGDRCVPLERAELECRRGTRRREMTYFHPA